MIRLGNEGLLHWRRFSADLLTAGATFAVVLAAFGDANALGLLVLPGALIGLSLMVEPDLSAPWLPGARMTPPPVQPARPEAI